MPLTSVTHQRENSVLWGFAGSLALACIYARSALLGLTSGVTGGTNDGYQNLWNNWWVKTAIFDLHRNPFFTDYIYYPTGTSLRFHTLNPLNGLLTLPFNLTIGYVPTINLLFVFSLCFTCFFSFLLIRFLTGNAWAAFAGAAVATFANFRVLGFLSAGQTQMISGEWLPLYILCMLLAIRSAGADPNPVPGEEQSTIRDHGAIRKAGSGKRWLIFAGLSVVLLLAMSLTDWQWVLYAVLLTVLYFVFLLVTRRPASEKLTVFGRLALIGGAYAALATPTLLVPMVREALSSPWLNVSYQSAVHAIDLADLVSPGLYNPGYLAIGAAALGLWAAWRAGRREGETALFWGLVIIIFYLFALGPELSINGENTCIPMPYALLQHLPVLSSGRDPGRFDIVALLGVGVLVAFGMKASMTWLADRMRISSLTVRAATAMLSALVVLLFLAADLSGFMVSAGDARTVPPDWPKFYEEIAQDDENYAILELPLFSDAGKGAEHYMAYQTLHRKFSFSGRLARDRKLTNPNNFVKHASLFRQLWFLNLPEEQQRQAYPDHEILQRTDYQAQGLSILNYYNVRYVILYKDAIGETDWPKFEGVVKEVLGDPSAPVYDDATLRAYEVPGAPPLANPLTLDVGSGWYSSEVRSDGVAFRWADRVNHELADQPNDVPGQLLTMNLSSQPVHATLRFSAYSYKQPRTLKVALNGYDAATMQLSPTEPKDYSVPMSLPPGNNIITLASPEKPLPTDDPATDSRLLSFAVYGVSLTR